MKINTGRGTIPLITLVGIWSVSALTSLPGCVSAKKNIRRMPRNFLCVDHKVPEHFYICKYKVIK